MSIFKGATELIPLLVMLTFTFLAIWTELIAFGRYDLLPANLPTLLLAALYISVFLLRKRGKKENDLVL